MGLSLFGTAIDIVSSIIQDVGVPTKQLRGLKGDFARALVGQDPSRVPQMIDSGVLRGP